MRRPLSAVRTGVCLAVAVALLTACGGSDDEAPSTSGEGRSSAPRTSAETADSGFCTQAAAIRERIGSTVGNPNQQANLPEVLQETATEIRAIEAPPEIAADWSALADGAEQIAGVIESVDPGDPAAFAAIEQQLGAVTGQLATASANVSTYLQDECGIRPADTEPAAPTS